MNRGGEEEMISEDVAEPPASANNDVDQAKGGNEVSAEDASTKTVSFSGSHKWLYLNDKYSVEYFSVPKGANL